ncbi:GNAT family N-acetyltransferase [Luteimonas sp. XNQY3]|nr:GNAT family N-acetyltransferase [Luteimonas sp. XNQY3]MCD9007684.1 GNAT family N-acetyltransferase [Luteimonas sp. XNQY3]
MLSGPLPRVVIASTTQAEAVRRLALTATQAVYAGDIAFHVDNAMAARDSDAMVVLLGDTVIGFYRLDYPTPVAATRDVDRRPVVLRAFALGMAWQGRGLGLPTLAACCADLARRHPGRPWLELTVHVANTVALHLYRRAGFVASEGMLPGGSGGPQHLMRRALGVGQWPP